MAEDDLRGHLPDPPPASPLRRDAAIDEAMRRFDGHPASPAARPKRVRPVGVRWIGRPQFGALVTVGLMAVIGVPAAWLAVERREDAARTSSAPAARDPAAASDAATPMSGAAPAPPAGQADAVARRDAAPPAIARAGHDSLPAEAKPASKAAEREQTLSTDRSASRRAAPAVEGPPMVPPPVMAIPAAPASPPPAGLAEAAPAAPPIARDRVTDPVIATGSRMSARRSERRDWQACTIDDPMRDLSLCSQALGAAKPGIDGAAAAHVADGVSRAWRGDMAGAIQSFSAAIAIAPTSADAYLNRSLAFARLRDGNRALADANEAVRHAPLDARTYYNRSVVLGRLGRVASARKDEQRAVALDPSYAAVTPQ